LRERPDPRAALQHEEIKNGKELRVLSWDLVDGYLHVTTDLQGDSASAAGWIRTCHIWSYHGGSVYKPLTDDEWYPCHWQCKSELCSIRVLRSGYTYEEIEEEMTKMGLEEKKHRKHLKLIQAMVSDTGCTYVCLRLGKTFRGYHEVCSNACHITIGYVAVMSDDEMKKLFAILSEILEQWRHLEPKERPAKLIRCRQFRVQKQEEVGYDVFTNTEIAKMPWTSVTVLLDEHRVDSTTVVEPLELPAYAQRLWIRERSRLQEAKERASSLQPHTGILDMFQCESGLNGTSFEMEDLLEYLADAVQHYGPAYGRSNVGKLVPPFLTHPTRWHCTRQGDWQRTRLL